ncbi:hypothetical protein N9K67_08255 [Opitutaceae bacterium]|nr:hypothetical protein [Opitutaceae bacterium]
MSGLLYEARRTLVLAGPIIVGQVSQMLMGVTDALMIGHVGKVPLAASAFAGSLSTFLPETWDRSATVPECIIARV